MAAPGIIGFQVETQYNQIHNQLSHSNNLKVVEYEYERGWFGSISHTKLALQMPVKQTDGKMGVEAVNLNFVSHINHGPLVSSGAGLAEVMTSIGLETAALTEPYSADIHTLISFGNTGTSKVNMPAVDIPASGDRPNVVFAGAIGEVTFALDMSDVRSLIEMQSLQVTAASGNPLLIGPLKLSTHAKQSESGLMVGGGYFELGQVRVEDLASGASLSLDNMKIEALSDEQSGLVETQINYRFDQLIANKEKFGPAEFSVELSQLPAEALLQIQQGVEEINAQNLGQAQKSMAVMSVLMGSAPALLKEDPKLAIKKLNMNTPDGEVKGHLTLQTVGLVWAEMTNPTALLDKVVGDAALQLPETLLLKLLKRQMLTQTLRQIKQRRLMGEEIDIDAATLEAQIEQQSKQQLEVWLTQQFVVREGSEISTVATLSKGLLTVNGKTLPLAGI